MKISLRWLCDHINKAWHEIDVNRLVTEFNLKTAEIESVTHYKLKLDQITWGTVKTLHELSVELFLPVEKQVISLSMRTGLVTGQWYMLIKETEKYRWAVYADLHSEQTGALGAFALTEKDVLTGAWKSMVEDEDYIFEVDNKSITHRPDLWGHRGIAREIAFFFDTHLKPEEDFLYPLPSTGITPFPLHIQTGACLAAGVVGVSGISTQPSILAVALRLIRLGHKHHETIVDLTNYVMLDLGHPMHAFDAEKIAGNQLTIRMAHHNESLELLDGSSLALTGHDIVVADADKALSLAGIRGGEDSGIHDTTRNIVLEAACFDASTIRLSSVHHKIRTESSARFEKSLDPYALSQVLSRYLHLLKYYAIAYDEISSYAIQVPKAAPKIIELEHAFVERILGVSLTTDFIKRALSVVGFLVEVVTANLYNITVPSYRATKDVSLPEDIVEEIGRLYGFTQLPTDIAYQGKQPCAYSWFDVQSKIKHCLAENAGMHEVLNYALFDNDWIKKIQWSVHHAVVLKNPLSEQRTTLVTSLVPHLLQNIDENMANNDSLQFFEWARVWHLQEHDILEKRVVAGIWYERKKEIDFYACKQHLQALFDLLQCTVRWEKQENGAEWGSMYQTAALYHHDQCIGYAGMVRRSLMQYLDAGNAWAFELDADFLQSYQSKQPVFEALAKYQATYLDVTVQVHEKVTVAQLTHALKNVDPRIFDVTLHAIFTKPEWVDQKSVTMRFYVRDEYKTMEKNEIDAVYAKVNDVLSAFEGK